MRSPSSSGGVAPRAGELGAVATLCLLAAWLGAALVTAAVVAPAAFAVLPSRALAGALVGRVLPVLFVSGALVAALTFWEAARGLPSRGRRIRIGAALVLAAGCVLAQAVIAPRIERVRRNAGVPIDALAPTDASRVAFGRLHGASVGALGVAMLAGALALALGARNLVRSADARGERGSL